MLENIIKLLEKAFAKQWVVALAGAGGVLLCFAVFLTVGLLAGDFVKNRRAVLVIARGEIEDGLKRLKGFAPAYDKSREVSPPESAFDYDKIIGFPYSYSLIKKLPQVTLASAAFFTVLAAAASVIAAGGLTHYTSFMLIFVPLVGLVLYIGALIIAGTVHKSAIKRYHGMIDLIKDVNVRPAGVVTAEEEFIPAAVAEICERIQEIALGGGAGHEDLSRLYNQIMEQKEKNLGGEAGERLAAALEVLSALIDSAI